MAAAYGTAYGVMAGAKAAMFGALLLLGLGNFLVVERLRSNPATSVLRMRRFAEVEIGIGFSIFFAAASLTSVPPPSISRPTASPGPRSSSAIRLTGPAWSRPITTPSPCRRCRRSWTRKPLQRDRGRARLRPGSGDLPVRNAADIAWSEYNHHWSGLFVVIIGVLGLLQRAGIRWARHWPLALLGLAVFLFLRSDPEVWPLGAEGFFASLRDIEVLQHRMFVVLIVAFAVFEWGVRTGRLRSPKLAPGLSPTHSPRWRTAADPQPRHCHVKDQLLIELTHTPLALAGIAAGWARWLEIRADGPVQRIAGWTWPICFLFIGALLLLYREA